MARNLLRNGQGLLVYDIDPAAMQMLTDHGARAATGPAQIGAECEMIFLSLPAAAHVRQVLNSTDVVLSTARPGTMVVDTSSLSPADSRGIEEQCRVCGVLMLDAPVSGGEPKAIDGTLAIMVGGDQAVYEEAKPLFDVMGDSAVLVGPIGSGNTCKLTNQIIVALNIAALSEGMLLAQMAGTDPRKVFEAIKGGLAGSTVMNAKAPMMLAGNFKPGFKIDLHIKDLANALDTAAAVGTPLMLTAEVMQMLQHLHRVGEGQSDHSAILKFYEKMADTEVRSEG
jgi:2-hydroxy-3-oxopropionate reductase